MMGSVFEKRQTYDTTDTGAGSDYYWNYSTTAIAVKWAVIGAIVLLIFLWLVGGYFHAQRRIKKGKRPFAYHMFLVPRRQRAAFFPQPTPNFYNPNQGVYRPQEYPLQAYPPPPPAYNAEHYAPPQYQPPEGGSKINPEQDYTAPPAGAPPGDVGRGESSHAAAGPAAANVNHENAEQVAPGIHSDLPPREAPRSSMMARMNPFNYGTTERAS